MVPSLLQQIRYEAASAKVHIRELVPDFTFEAGKRCGIPVLVDKSSESAGIVDGQKLWSKQTLPYFDEK